MKISTVLLFAMSFIGTPAVSAASSSDVTRVVTSYGEITGLERTTTISYLGVPYAAPPTGKLRWKAPVPPAKWKTLRADRFGEACPQLSLMSGTYKGNEDCLTLNVWRPKKVDRPLPVLFWIHGGGNSIGSSYQPIMGSNLYDGARLAEEGTIVVSINYRLGALGFLAHPELRASTGLSGNYAILDQIRALRFVRDEITAFGGDPANVTIFGESAGGIDVLVLMASPLSKGLFSKAIVQSGFLSDLELTDASKLGESFVDAAGCGGRDTVTCLHSMSAEQLVATSRKLTSAKIMAFGATIDGYVLRESVLKTLRSGRFTRVPVIIGNNRDEMRTLASGLIDFGSRFSDADYRDSLVAQFGAVKAKDVYFRYPSSEYASPRLAAEEVLSDLHSHCPTRRVVRALVANGVPTYNYLFTHLPHPVTLWPYKAGHAMELPFVFGTLTLDRSIFEWGLSKDIRGYWTRFAATGNPNVSAQSTWPLAMKDRYLDLAVTQVAKSDFKSDLCDFWDGF